MLDTTAGSTLVTGYFTGLELKNMLEFFLVDNPAHPGEYFPRTSGLKVRHDMSRPKFDVVTALELGDLDRRYKAIDIAGKDARLYSLTTPLYLATILVAIPKYTKGKLPLQAKKKDGQPLTSKVEALDDLRSGTPELLPPAGTLDKASITTTDGTGAPGEIKEWQAIMDHLRNLPAKNSELPIITGGGIEFMRPLAGESLWHPTRASHRQQRRAEDELRDGKPVLIKLPEIAHNDDKDGKPVGIQCHIGHRTLMACGNSDGDFEMLAWTTAGAGPRFGMLIHHTDADREWAYDRDSHVGNLDKGLDGVSVRTWVVTSMKDDWKAIFPEAATAAE